MRIIVLGAGRVGRVIARDLAGDADFQVTVADVSREALAVLEQSAAIATVRADLGRPDEVARVVAGHDLVVGAVPGPIGYQTLRARDRGRRRTSSTSPSSRRTRSRSTISPESTT